MTYREKLEMYKNGALSKSEQIKLEEEIEKVDAISEYLYDRENIPKLNSLNLSENLFEKTGDKQTKNFAKVINISIRKAFIKLGVTVGAITLVITLLFLFVTPKFIASFYYNPAEIVATQENGNDTKRIDIDLSVYTELTIPCQYRNYAVIEDKGYGEYSIEIPQVSYINRIITLNGIIKKNKLSLYNTDVLKYPFANAFKMPESEGEGLAAGTTEDAFKAIDKLKDNTCYKAYFSLKEYTDYGKFYKWFKSKDFDNIYDLWCGIKTADTDNPFLGVSPTAAGYVYAWDYEKYPKLSLLDGRDGVDIEKDIENEEIMEEHFTSMLRYMNDHPDTAELFNIDNDWEGKLNFVKENGMKLYGFVVTAEKETIKKIADEEVISYVYTTPSL